MNNLFVPSIIETIGRSQKAFDLPTKLLQNRIVYLGNEITSDVANIVIMQLLWLSSDDSSKEINLYINSPGGDVYAGLAIKDIIYKIDCKVNTIGLGLCASMGAYLLASGTGVRKATENCRIMVHSVSSMTKGTIHDIEIDYKESLYLQEKMLKDLTSFSKGKCTEQTFKAITQRDFWLSPEDAIIYGLVDMKIV